MFCAGSYHAMASTVEGGDTALLPEFPRGPLDAYRARASFSWKELALFTEGEDMLRFKVRCAVARLRAACLFSQWGLSSLAEWDFWLSQRLPYNNQQGNDTYH